MMSLAHEDLAFNSWLGGSCSSFCSLASLFKAIGRLRGCLSRFSDSELVSWLL